MARGIPLGECRKLSGYSDEIAEALSGYAGSFVLRVYGGKGEPNRVVGAHDGEGALCSLFSGRGMVFLVGEDEGPLAVYADRIRRILRGEPKPGTAATVQA